MIDWKPFKTAPKDGTHILLFIEHRVMEGYYNDRHKWQGENERWAVTRLPSHGCGCCGGDDNLPTHWAEFNRPIFRCPICKGAGKPNKCGECRAYVCDACYTLDEDEDVICHDCKEGQV
jgi:hypothetical protein